MLLQTPTLDAADHKVLRDIEALRCELRHQVAEPRRWLGQLRRSLQAGAIRGSNTIEGYTISVEDAEALVAREEMSAGPDAETKAAVTGYRDAMSYVQQAGHFDTFTFDRGLLSVLHFMMINHDFEKGPGRYRNGGIWVTGGPGNPPVYTGPDAEKIPGLINELLDWLNTGDLDSPVFVRAAMAHLNLVSIHPWRDGNGRMSRCLQTLVLARDKVLAPDFSSIEEWLGMSTYNTGLYYSALNSTGASFDPKADTHDWIRFSLRTHHLQAQLVQRRAADATRLWQLLEAVAARHGLHERTLSALFAAANDTLRRSTYQVDENLTRDQAVRDIQALKRAGLVEQTGQGRAQRYRGGVEVMEIARELRESSVATPLRDPYAD